MLENLLKEAEQVQDLKSQKGIMINFFNLFKSGKVPEGDILEIGCFLGKTTVFLSRMCEELYPSRKVFSIDPHTDDSLQEISMKNKEENIVHNHFLKYTKDLTNHTHFREYSYNAVDKFEDYSLAFIFIDGLHSYEGVKKDYENYLKKAQIGGIIVFDDYKNNKFGVGKFINEVVNKDSRVKLIMKEAKELYYKVIDK